MMARLAGDIDELRNLMKVERDQLRMLVEIYFPALEPKLAQVDGRAKEFSDAVGESMRTLGSPQAQTSQIQERLYEAFCTLDDSCTDFLREVSGLSSDYLK